MMKNLKSKMTPGIAIMILLTISLSGQDMKRGIAFKEVVAIGIEEALRDEDKPYELSDVGMLEIDDQANIYVLEGRTCQVKKFDKTGKFIKTIITKGQGPGEMSSPVNFTINRFTHTLFILQTFGFVLKEFDLEGKSIKEHSLPEQFFFYFEFIDKDRFIFPAKDEVDKNDYYCFKIASLTTRKVEKQWYKISVDISLNSHILFFMKDNLFWSSSENQMELLAFDLDKDKMIKRIKIPGEIKKNFMKVIKEDVGMRTLSDIMYNYIQTFVFDNQVYVLLTRQEYKNEHERARTFPEKISQELYILEGDRLSKIDGFKGFNGMVLSRVRGNLLLLRADDPYPCLKIVEMQKNDADRSKTNK